MHEGLYGNSECIRVGKLLINPKAAFPGLDL